MTCDLYIHHLQFMGREFYPYVLHLIQYFSFALQIKSVSCKLRIHSSMRVVVHLSCIFSVSCLHIGARPRRRFNLTWPSQKVFNSMSVYQWATYTKQERAKDELLLILIFYYFNQSMLWDPLETVL